VTLHVNKSVYVYVCNCSIDALSFLRSLLLFISYFIAVGNNGLSYKPVVKQTATKD